MPEFAARTRGPTSDEFKRRLRQPGVMRWTPPSGGVYATRASVWDLEPGQHGVCPAQGSEARKARSAVTPVNTWPVMPSASAARTFSSRLSMNTVPAALMPRSSSACW